MVCGGCYFVPSLLPQCELVKGPDGAVSYILLRYNKYHTLNVCLSSFFFFFSPSLMFTHNATVSGSKPLNACCSSFSIKKHQPHTLLTVQKRA